MVFFRNISFINFRNLCGLAVAAALLFSPVNAHANPKYAALVIDADTGTVIHQENAGQYRYPASLVKMMTVYMVFREIENGRLSMTQMIPVSQHAAQQAPSSLFLKPGSSIAVKDAIMAVIIKSANDAAVVLGEAVSGSELKFAQDMNAMAKKLGMEHTNFRNASGLPDPKQVSTAYDLARLGIALRRDYPQYYNMFNVSQFTYKGQVYRTHNRVTKNYDGADGIKTGYVRASGFNLVTSAERNGKRLVGVVLGGRTYASRDQAMMTLLDNAFSGVSMANNSVSYKNIAAYEDAVPQAKPKAKAQKSANTTKPKAKPKAATKKNTTSKKVANTTPKKKAVANNNAPKNVVIKKKPTNYASLDE